MPLRPLEGIGVLDSRPFHLVATARFSSRISGRMSFVSRPVLAGGELTVAAVAVTGDVGLRGGKRSITLTATSEPPIVGEHTPSVLAECGFENEEIDQLGADGVI